MSVDSVSKHYISLTYILHTFIVLSSSSSALQIPTVNTDVDDVKF